MKLNRIKSLIFLCALSIILTFSACKKHETYSPSPYTKDEVQALYRENSGLFENVVEIISSNGDFFEKGRINEYTDADIVSPYDDAMQFFDDTERKIINEFFDLKPYMLYYDYARRFVTITFIASDNVESYSFLFWTKSDEGGVAKLDNYKAYLSQNYIIESITEHSFMYYLISEKT